MLFYFAYTKKGTGSLPFPVLTRSAAFSIFLFRNKTLIIYFKMTYVKPTFRHPALPKNDLGYTVLPARARFRRCARGVSTIRVWGE